jgi:hypothetical protein
MAINNNYPQDPSGSGSGYYGNHQTGSDGYSIPQFNFPEEVGVGADGEEQQFMDENDNEINDAMQIRQQLQEENFKNEEESKKL